jgi:hypothetical protein
MNSSHDIDEKCPSCHGPLGPWSVNLAGGGSACSDACASAHSQGSSLDDAKAEDYSTMAIGVDVLRKALLRHRG